MRIIINKYVFFFICLFLTNAGLGQSCSELTDILNRALADPHNESLYNQYSNTAGRFGGSCTQLVRQTQSLNHPCRQCLIGLVDKANKLEELRGTPGNNTGNTNTTNKLSQQDQLQQANAAAQASAIKANLSNIADQLSALINKKPEQTAISADEASSKENVLKANAISDEDFDKLHPASDENNTAANPTPLATTFVEKREITSIDEMNDDAYEALTKATSGEDAAKALIAINDISGMKEDYDNHEIGVNTMHAAIDAGTASTMVKEYIKTNQGMAVDATRHYGNDNLDKMASNEEYIINEADEHNLSLKKLYSRNRDDASIPQKNSAEYNRQEQHWYNSSGAKAMMAGTAAIILTGGTAALGIIGLAAFHVLIN